MSLPTVVITHGWQPLDTFAGGPPTWVQTMANAIAGRLFTEGRAANIVCFAWREAFTLPLIFPQPFAGLAYADGFTETQGNKLATEIRALLSPLGEKYNQPIHFIGHSLGSIVNAVAIKILSEFDSIQFTILDAPFAVPGRNEQTFHCRLPSSRVSWVDNYIGIDGRLPTPGVGEPVTGAAPNGGLTLPYDHVGIHDYYQTTIETNAPEGFFWSSLLNNISARPNPTSWQPLSCGLLRSIAMEVPTKLGVGFRIVLGVAVQLNKKTVAGQLRDSVIRLFEMSPSAIASDVTIPANGNLLTFDLQFPQAGDGDWLTVSFNDTLLISFSGESFVGTEFQHIEIPIGQLAGQTGVLTVKLNSTGAANAEVLVSNFQFLSSAQDTTPPDMDFDGDGKTDIGLYRNGAWFILRSSDNGITVKNWGGLAQDIPVPADYDGDGMTDVAVYRDGVWFIIRSTDSGITVTNWGGLVQDVPVPADYDGDGKSDVAVYRDGVWFITRSSDNGITVTNWGGLAQDTPVPGDYDGDGKTDVAVFRDGAWFILKSSGGIQTMGWGAAGDVPLN